MKKSMKILGATALVLFATASIGATAASAHTDAPRGKGAEKTVTLTANLSPLNGSGATGIATAIVRNQKISHIEVHAKGLTPNAPHAQHIHYGQQALNECPTIDLDKDGNGRINTAEGLPAYGPVVVSLTTTGDTLPSSVLAVDRYPVADKTGMFHYSRDNIEFTAVAGTGYTAAGGTAKQIADSVRAGEGVVVIHGVDYNGNGRYDFTAGKSELNPAFPSEATDPASCGVLELK